MLDDVADEEIGRIALELRRPVDLGPGVDEAVMAAIRAAPLMVSTPPDAGARPTARRAPRGGLRWLTRSRTVRVRVSPFGALAAAGVAIAAIFGLRREITRDRSHQDLAGTGEFPALSGEYPAVGARSSARVHDTVFVTRFVFVAPTARQVAIAGDFNDWSTDSTRLVKSDARGVWTVDVPLAPGRYHYAFYVDGERWVADPAAPPSIGNDFGRPSSVVTVRPQQSL